MPLASDFSLMLRVNCSLSNRRLELPDGNARHPMPPERGATLFGVTWASRSQDDLMPEPIDGYARSASPCRGPIRRRQPDIARSGGRERRSQGLQGWRSFLLLAWGRSVGSMPRQVLVPVFTFVGCSAGGPARLALGCLGSRVWLRTRKGITSHIRKGTVPFSLRENWDSPQVVCSRALIGCGGL